MITSVLCAGIGLCGLLLILLREDRQKTFLGVSVCALILLANTLNVAFYMLVRDQQDGLASLTEYVSYFAYLDYYLLMGCEYLKASQQMPIWLESDTYKKQLKRIAAMAQNQLTTTNSSFHSN